MITFLNYLPALIFGFGVFYAILFLRKYLTTNIKVAMIGAIGSLLISWLLINVVNVATNSGIGKPVGEKIEVPSVDELKEKSNNSEMVDKLRKPDKSAEQLDKDFNEMVDWKKNK